MKRRKLATVTAMTGAVLVAGATSAVAAASGTFTLGTTGVTFTSASYNFYVGQSNGTDFGYRGNLNDTASDGNNVFVHGKVAGYGYGPRLYSPGYKEQYLNDPAATAVNSAAVQACQDRGVFSDLCSAKTFYR